MLQHVSLSHQSRIRRLLRPFRCVHDQSLHLLWRSRCGQERHGLLPRMAVQDRLTYMLWQIHLSEGQQRRMLRYNRW